MGHRGPENPDYHLVAQPDGDDRSFSLAVYVPNVDEAVAKAVERGATMREEVFTFVNGDRFASILDPHGIRWTVMTRVEDLSDAEAAERVAAWAAEQSYDHTPEEQS